MMKKPWKNTYKMHDACSFKSKLSCNHSWFILFFKRRNSAKKWKRKSNNPSFNYIDYWDSSPKDEVLDFWGLFNQKSKNPSFQTESLDSGQKDGFLDFPRFFWIFLDSSKGCLDFWVSKSKIQKNSRKKMDFWKNVKNPRKKMDFCKNPKKTRKKMDFSNPDIKKSKKPRKKMDFCKIPKKHLGKRWIFSNPDIKNPKKLKEKDGFFQKIQKNAGKSWIFAKIHLFPWVFLDFWLGNPKIQTPFRRIQKNLKKNPRKSKNPSFWPESKDSVWKMDFWIFGFFGSRLDHACLQHSDIR